MWPRTSFRPRPATVGNKPTVVRSEPVSPANSRGDRVVFSTGTKGKRH